jgi:hypothetical protein
MGLIVSESVGSGRSRVLTPSKSNRHFYVPLRRTISNPQWLQCSYCVHSWYPIETLTYLLTHSRLGDVQVLASVLAASRDDDDDDDDDDGGGGGDDDDNDNVKSPKGVS